MASPDFTVITPPYVREETCINFAQRDFRFQRRSISPQKDKLNYTVSVLEDVITEVREIIISPSGEKFYDESREKITASMTVSSQGHDTTTGKGNSGWQYSITIPQATSKVGWEYSWQVCCQTHFSPEDTNSI